MPYVIMAIGWLIVVASYVLPVKWILEDRVASNQEKVVFILLVIPFWIFSYYLFHAYKSYFKAK